MGYLKHLLTLLCCSMVFSTGLCFVNQCFNESHFEMIYTNETDLLKADFRNCMKAVYVNVSFNRIAALRNDTLGFLYSVQVLDLSHNQLALIPDNALQVMRKLKHLNISHNLLETLPLDFFNNKPSLLSVDLSHNRITGIPLPVFTQHMLRLNTVNLQHNRLTEFEPWAYVGQMICVVDVRYNNISTFTNHYNWTFPGYDDTLSSSCASGYPLTDLRNNMITTWDDQNLLQYGVSYEAFYAVIGAFMNIKDNPLHCDCSWFNITRNFTKSFYGYSNFDSNDFRCASPAELSGKRIMYEIPPHQFVCNLTSNCPVGCLCQERPNRNVLSIDCEGWGLDELPAAVPVSRFNKLTMNLANNSIRHLRNVTYLNRIKNIAINNNKLEDIPRYFMETMIQNGVHFVDVRNNSLTSIPECTATIKYQNAKISGNQLECGCDMLWMVKWIQVAPDYMYKEKQLGCTFKRSVHNIIELTEDILECHNVGFVAMTVVLSVALACIIALVITAKRCPYETKVLLFRIFRIHPKDKYVVDSLEEAVYDMYVSFDDDDDYVRQWVMKVLFKKLEKQKPFYKLCAYIRNGTAGSEAEGRLDLIDKSKRLLVIISRESERKRWCEFELCHAETLEHNDGRVLFILYDNTAVENASKEPLLALLGNRKVFTLTDCLLWSKLRYEMPPVKRASKENAIDNEINNKVPFNEI